MAVPEHLMPSGFTAWPEYSTEMQRVLSLVHNPLSGIGTVAHMVVHPYERASERGRLEHVSGYQSARRDLEPPQNPWQEGEARWIAHGEAAWLHNRQVIGKGKFGEVQGVYDHDKGTVMVRHSSPVAVTHVRPAPLTERMREQSLPPLKPGEQAHSGLTAQQEALNKIIALAWTRPFQRRSPKGKIEEVSGHEYIPEAKWKEGQAEWVAKGEAAWDHDTSSREQVSPDRAAAMRMRMEDAVAEDRRSQPTGEELRAMDWWHENHTGGGQVTKPRVWDWDEHIHNVAQYGEGKGADVTDDGNNETIGAVRKEGSHWVAMHADRYGPLDKTHMTRGGAVSALVNYHNQMAAKYKSDPARIHELEAKEDLRRAKELIGPQLPGMSVKDLIDAQRKALGGARPGDVPLADYPEAAVYEEELNNRSFDPGQEGVGRGRDFRSVRQELPSFRMTHAEAVAHIAESSQNFGGKEGVHLATNASLDKGTWSPEEAKQIEAEAWKLVKSVPKHSFKTAKELQAEAEAMRGGRGRLGSKDSEDRRIYAASLDEATDAELRSEYEQADYGWQQTAIREELDRRLRQALPANSADVTPVPPNPLLQQAMEARKKGPFAPMPASLYKTNRKGETQWNKPKRQPEPGEQGALFTGLPAVDHLIALAFGPAGGVGGMGGFGGGGNRHVRTAAGVAMYKVPIGTLITARMRKAATAMHGGAAESSVFGAQPEVDEAAAADGLGWIPRPDWLQGQQLWEQRGKSAWDKRAGAAYAKDKAADAAADKDTGKPSASAKTNEADEHPSEISGHRVQAVYSHPESQTRIADLGKGLHSEVEPGKEPGPVMRSNTGIKEPDMKARGWKRSIPGSKARAQRPASAAKQQAEEIAKQFGGVGSGSFTQAEHGVFQGAESSGMYTSSEIEGLQNQIDQLRTALEKSAHSGQNERRAKLAMDLLFLTGGVVFAAVVGGIAAPLALAFAIPLLMSVAQALSEYHIVSKEESRLQEIAAHPATHIGRAAKAVGHGVGHAVGHAVGVSKVPGPAKPPAKLTALIGYTLALSAAHAQGAEATTVQVIKAALAFHGLDPDLAQQYAKQAIDKASHERMQHMVHHTNHPQVPKPMPQASQRKPHLKVPGAKEKALPYGDSTPAASDSQQQPVGKRPGASPQLRAAGANGPGGGGKGVPPSGGARGRALDSARGLAQGRGQVDRGGRGALAGPGQGNGGQGGSAGSARPAPGRSAPVRKAGAVPAAAQRSGSGQDGGKRRPPVPGAGKPDSAH